MEKAALILKDGTSIEMEQAASLSAIQVSAQDRDGMVEIWKKFTPENLEEVQVKNSSGMVTGNYADLVLVSETSVMASDGSVRTTYRLREKTEVEKLTEHMEAVDEVLEIHTGALNDLGEITSLMAEQTEGEAE
ncbi:hypothetical protein [Lacrimispora sp. 210928-DFI.3.58]|uniref:hypothetical protein n=1 Tax=Lacrimispora sp. 210928-DFI.3.58 TaxID=2883214 RepID=UPI001D072A44|nr:hypothetical protein [Lacrimispora sp. 210928-DFI.3.58]MCB7317525.1 hypothetical protein [Lacrimispora sp. 210928-DFI.3.58]